jgi:membrane protease YdiL (CAAX protease family)
MSEYLLLFDPNKPAPSFNNILLWTIAIMLIGNIIFLILCKLKGINIKNSINNSVTKEYAIWKSRNISPIKVALTELINSIMYSPIAEELVFRLVLMKTIFVEKLKINPYISSIMQGLIFGAIHSTNEVFGSQSCEYTSLQSLSSTITGIITGWVYVKSNSILPCLLAHILNNTSASINTLVGYNNYIINK